jgi:enamine deaminase RidA (YjgF/YER057c/UK114 family)
MSSADMLPLAPINPDALGRPSGFSHGIVAGAGLRTLFVAGQTAADSSGHVAGGTFEHQFDVALTRVLAVVEAAGGRAEHVARMTVYVTDLEAYRHARPALSDIWRQRFGRHYPAMTLVEVSRLVDVHALLEIDAVAMLP